MTKKNSRTRATSEALKIRKEYTDLFINNYRNSPECDAVVDITQINWDDVKTRKETLTTKELYNILFTFPDRPLQEDLSFPTFKKFLSDSGYEWDSKGHFILPINTYTRNLELAFYYLLKENPINRMYRADARKEIKSDGTVGSTIDSPLVVFFENNLFLPTFVDILNILYNGKIQGIAIGSSMLTIHTKKITFSKQIEDSLENLLTSLPKY